MISRRRFLELGTLAGASFLVPKILKSFEHKATAGNKKLVIIELSGGNDGLNTLVHFRNDAYYRSRPTIALREGELLKLNDEIGFHPALRSLRALYDAGNVSIVNNVGYPNHSRSHFRSMDIWHTASVDNKQRTGWLGRYMDVLPAGENTVFELDNEGGRAVSGKYRNAGILSERQQISTVASAAGYPDTQLANKLKLIACDIQQQAGTKVYYLSHGSFDTHVGQKDHHARLLCQLDEAVGAFTSDLKKTGKFEDVAVVTFSEFGRRVAENAHEGTDHGAANNMFVIGGSLQQAGCYNELPDLDDLDEGDIKYTIDFRQVYASLLERWLGADARSILGGNFTKLSFV